MDDCFVNLGDEVILTFLWEYGASESATARMFCSDGSVLNDSFILNKSLMWLEKNESSRGVIR